MTEVAVCMRAYNTGKYIKEAIESVLKQEGIKFELIVVDDGSNDNTADIANSFEDPRIKVIKNINKMGNSYCHNLMIEQSKSPFIVHVDSDHVLLPRAIRKLMDKIKSSNKIGQVHCYNFVVNEEGGVTRNSFHKKMEYLRNTLKPDMDYRKELLSNGLVINGLQIYRKEVFDTVGKFDEKITFDGNYDFCLRILDKFEIALLPEFLYFSRKYKRKLIKANRIKKLIKWFKKLFIYRRLLKSDKVSYLKQKKYKVNRFMIHDLYDALELQEMAKRTIRIPKNIFKYFNRYIINPIFNTTYCSMSTHFSWWSIDLFTSKKENKQLKDKRIAYYIWQYPVSSQTFIQREVSALINSGLYVQVISEIKAEDEFLEEFRSSLLKHTHYLDLTDENKLLKYKIYFFFKNPLLYMNLFLYIVFHRYHVHKTLNFDKNVFSKAIYLAGVSMNNNINHIHSPWADICAFISLIASKLLGVSYSVQARAHDIHRKKYLYGLSEKFDNADFIITNTQYNASYISSIVNHRNGKRINKIYNGLNLDRFKPEQSNRNVSNRINILSVARLIEPKGIVYLLKACKILKEDGYEFKCEIIGGPEDLYMNYYLTLKKLHRQLGLEDDVFFLDTQPFNKVLHAYKNADIFVLPCVTAEDGTQDITPNSLIEAMAMKLPVISTNQTGIPEIVDDGVNGILVSPNDEYALTEAVIKLIEDRNLRKKLGENAREKVNERFDIDKNVLQYIKLFNGLNKK